MRLLKAIETVSDVAQLSFTSRFNKVHNHLLAHLKLGDKTQLSGKIVLGPIEIHKVTEAAKSVTFWHFPLRSRQFCEIYNEILVTQVIILYNLQYFLICLCQLGTPRYDSTEFTKLINICTANYA